MFIKSVKKVYTENRPKLPQKATSRIPTIHFQGVNSLFVSRRVVGDSKGKMSKVSLLQYAGLFFPITYSFKQ